MDGILAAWMDSYSLYFISYIIYGFSLASSQLIFCNRVFLIMNMYQGLRTIRRTVQEVWVYISVGLMPLTMIPFAYVLTPNQEMAKRAMIRDYKIYPDCVYDINSVIVCNPLNNCAIIFAILNLANVFGSTFIIFYATHKAYMLLSKRMMTKSNKTKRMHQKFNKRTRLQVGGN
ncbi:hypothetical protein L5515_006473 [Caenorhabditis briggsae]|uniref:Uncharacterized protein n=1 Tax=Caenorhabditis briggsae TaxID=6238 RepID=A0AAE9F0T9_CAEBR|nr:hypothetical protein L5515_006473 [Caenorhabditis briggsae]